MLMLLFMLIEHNNCRSALSNLKMETSNSSTDTCSLHNPEINKQQLMDAVCNGDVETAKQLIGKGMDINFILNNWTPLHAAMERASMDMLELLLSQPNIDLNISNEGLNPPLLWVLQGHCWESSGDHVLRLIQAGCDVNIRNSIAATPLHYSVAFGMETITHELLKQAADVNAQCFEYSTPLYRAVEIGNLELVCMLLCYNADVYIKWEGQTPFSYALYLGDFEMAKVLNNYYSFLHDDVNYILNNPEVYMVFLKYSNAELFEAVWPRFDPEIILGMSPTFLYYYLHYCRYSTSDWVKCLYLMLNSDIAFDLIECFSLNHGIINFLDELERIMKYNCVQSEDRVGLIYMVLRLGFEVEINNINTAVMYYGLNQDLNPFIYGTYSSITDGSKFLCPLHAFVIVMETDYSVKKMRKLFHDASQEWNRWHLEHYKPMVYQEVLLREIFAKTVAFFSFPADVKNSIISLYNSRDYITTVGERLQEIPEFPSLTELSRNRIHKYLVQKFRFKQPYQLQDFVKKLLVPNRIKDVILFKAPIY